MTTGVNTKKFALGIDFGTESGRALLVDVATGEEIATYVHVYSNKVIDEKLPGTDIRLEPDWALQDPNDYIAVFQNAVPIPFHYAFSKTNIKGLWKSWCNCIRN